MAFDQIIGASLTTAGGVIVGVFLFWWRTRGEEKEELRQWYAKTERLAERVINSQDRPSESDDDLASASYLRNTCAGVHSMLASHLAEAPSGVEADVVVSCEELVEACQSVKDVHLTESNFDPRVFPNASEATDQAEIVRTKAESARKEV